MLVLSSFLFSLLAVTTSKKYVVQASVWPTPALIITNTTGCIPISLSASTITYNPSTVTNSYDSTITNCQPVNSSAPTPTIFRCCPNGYIFSDFRNTQNSCFYDDSDLFGGSESGSDGSLFDNPLEVDSSNDGDQDDVSIGIIIQQGNQATIIQGMQATIVSSASFSTFTSFLPFTDFTAIMYGGPSIQVTESNDEIYIIMSQTVVTAISGGSTTSFTATTKPTPDFCDQTKKVDSSSSLTKNKIHNDVANLSIPFTLIAIVFTGILFGACIIL